jgi:hypothetical protein
MRKMGTALIAATSIGVATLAMSSMADARWHRGWGWGPGPVISALAAGAFVAGALAAPPPYYYPVVAYAPYPYYGPACGRVWNGFAWVWVCV